MKNIFIMLCFFISFVSCSNTNIANTNNTNVIMSTNDDGSIVFEQKDIVYNIDYIPNVVYANKDNTDLTLQIMIPRTLNVDTNAKYPLVVYIQGSAWRKQNVYRNLVALGDFARRGYVVAIVEYRPSDTAIFPAQIEDTRDAIKFMLDNSDKYNADTNKAATMTDVQNAVAGLSGAMHYVGESTTDPSTGTATVEGHEDWVAGDVVTYNAKEYVYDGENWRELGDESSYAIKGSIVDADIAPNANIAQSKIANLVTDLAAKATPADITSAIEALDVASQAVATGNKITAIEQVDGKISITTGAIVNDDIPELPQTKITGLTTALAGKQDALTMDGTYNAESNKVATQSTVTNAIGALDFDDTAVAHQFITEVNETNGVISVQRAALSSDDIPELTASKITDLDTTISGAIDEAITTDGAIDEAISGAVTEAIAGVAGTVAAVENNFVTSISMANGVLTGTVAQPTIANINGLQTALDAKANTSSLGYFATGTDATHLTLDSGNYLILNGGGAAGF